MTRTSMIVGLIATLVMTPLGPAFSITAAGAETKANGNDLLVLKQEIATIQAELQKFGAQAETKKIDFPTTPDCVSLPEALLVSEAARGLCR